MSSSWRVYVGAEVPASTATGSTVSGASSQELLDTAFARRARLALQKTPPAIRQHPSAAPSPVLRWLLQMENKKPTGAPDSSSWANHHQAKVRAHEANVHVARHAADASEEPLSDSIGVSASALAPGLPPPAAAATTVLARRGVGPKDPLLQRLLKKKQQQQQQQVGSAAVTNGTAIAVPPSHWTQHPFSAMTSTSWRVFRQQLGITIELVAPAKANTSANAGTAAAAAATVGGGMGQEGSGTPAPLPAAELLPAIRCWEEAQLPLSLGRCVTTLYSLPTAVQAQCVPLALLPSPASLLQESSTQAQQQQQQPTSSPASSKALRSVLPATATSLGMDVLAVAETGSGKTAAYLVPLLSHVLCRAPKLLGYPDRISLGPLTLVIVPTRELAEQVTTSLLVLCGQYAPAAPAAAVQKTDLAAWEMEETAMSAPADVSASAAPLAAAPSTQIQRALSGRNHLSEFRVVKVVGGESREAQYNALAQGAHCVVGTVGQLQALLEDRLLSLGNTQFVVMDEADRMIDEQQEAKLVAVLERCPTPRQTLMFTATLSGACANVAKRYLAKSGYYLVRTPYRCASIRQSFELMSDTAGTDEAIAAAEDAASPSLAPPRQPRRLDSTGNPSASYRGLQQQQRRLHPLIHPQKFARLVCWLVYGTGPIIVFANEKATCDALFEELRAEAEHLEAQQEYFTLADLVGPPPDGLTFREGHGNGDGADARATSAVSTATTTAVSRAPSLANLTSVAVVHAELSQNERRSLVAQFQRRQRHVLITTDLLARGLDVAGVTLVVNYDLPWSATGTAADAVTSYIHRIGRTGRAGLTGVTVAFVTLPAAMVQRAEEVVREEAEQQQQQASAKTTSKSSPVGSFHARQERAGGRAATTADDDDDDPMSVLGELFDGDTHNVWVTGASSSSSVAVGGGGGRKRRRDASEADDEEAEEDGNTNRDDSNDDNGRASSKKRGKAKTGFASDVDALRPLWSFLTECAEGEGCKDGAAALRRGTYAKISVPPALACVMEQLSATSQFGHITL